MATKPRKYCLRFPCRNLSEPGSSYCQEHRPKPLAKLADVFYLTGRWRRFRDWYISKQPLCELCEKEGRTVPAVLVDHVVELRDLGAPYDETNVQALCASCHAKKTKQEAKKRGPVVYSYGEKSSATLRK